MSHSTMPDHLLSRPGRPGQPTAENAGRGRAPRKSSNTPSSRHSFRKVLDRTVTKHSHEGARPAPAKPHADARRAQQASLPPKPSHAEERATKTGTAAAAKDASAPHRPAQSDRDRTESVKSREGQASAHVADTSETRAAQTAPDEVESHEDDATNKESEHDETTPSDERGETSTDAEQASSVKDQARASSNPEEARPATSSPNDDAVDQQRAAVTAAAWLPVNGSVLPAETHNVAGEASARQAFAGQGQARYLGKGRNASSGSGLEAKLSGEPSLERATDRQVQEANAESQQEQDGSQDENEATGSSKLSNNGGSIKLSDAGLTAVTKNIELALQEVREQSQASRSGRATNNGTADAEKQTQMARARRQHAAAKVVNRMTLMHGARADIVLPELGRVSIQAHTIDGEVDVHLTTQDAGALAVLQSTSAAMESELRKSSIELRNLDMSEEELTADAEREGSESRAGNAEDGSEHRDGRSGRDEIESHSSTRANQVRIVL